MPISIECGSCGSKLVGPDHAAGRVARCPKCQSLTPVPLIARDGPAVHLGCVNCTHKEYVPEFFRNKKVVCSKCQIEFTVPADLPTSMIPDDHVISIGTLDYFKIIPAGEDSKCPHCEFLILPPPKRTKNCPKCGEKFWVRRGQLLTFEKLQDYIEAFENPCNLADNARRIRVERKRAMNELERLKDSALSMGQTEIRFDVTRDHTTCRFCRSMAGKKILISQCTAEMLPPFASCKHEKAREKPTDQTCRCRFTLC